jgi:hypothetical protein
VTQAETETDTNFADKESAIEEAMREQDVDDVVEYITSLIDHRLANVPTQQPQGNTHHQPMWPLLVPLAIPALKGVIDVAIKYAASSIPLDADDPKKNSKQSPTKQPSSSAHTDITLASLVFNVGIILTFLI